MIRVLIADDQALIRAGFRTILETQPDIRVVAEASNGAEAVTAAAAHSPDVVIMDVRMPRMDGIEGTRKLTGHRVLILTTFDHDEYVIEAVRAGASGFLLKDAPADELIRAVRVIAAGDALLAPSVTRRMLSHIADAAPVPPQSSLDLDRLTNRERAVLVQIARGKSNGEIAVELGIGETTVKTHVSHLLEKLELRDRIQAVVLAYEQGLVKPGDE